MGSPKSIKALALSPEKQGSAFTRLNDEKKRTIENSQIQFGSQNQEPPHSSLQEARDDGRPAIRSPRQRNGEKASPGLRTGQYVSPTLGRKHARIQNAIKSQQNIDYSERIHVSSAIKATNIQTDSESRPTEDLIESGGERDYLR